MFELTLAVRHSWEGKIAKMQRWKYEGCEYTNMQIYKYTKMQRCIDPKIKRSEYANIQICKVAKLQKSKDVKLQK